MKIHVLGTGLCYVGRILVQQQKLLLHIEGILKTILLEGDDAQGEGEGDVVKTSANKRMHGSQGNSFIRLIRLIPLPSYLRLLVAARIQQVQSLFGSYSERRFSSSKGHPGGFEFSSQKWWKLILGLKVEQTFGGHWFKLDFRIWVSAFPAQQATHVFVFNTAAQEGTTQDAKALRKRGGAFLLDTFLSFKAISMACTMHARSESLPLQLTSQENPEDMKEPMERMRWWELTFSIRGFENVTVETLKLFWTVSLGSDNPKKHRNRASWLQILWSLSCGAVGSYFHASFLAGRYVGPPRGYPAWSPRCVCRRDFPLFSRWRRARFSLQTIQLSCTNARHSHCVTRPGRCGIGRPVWFR